MNQTESTQNLDCIAIIGMAVRMPGALNVEQFWENLSSGTESISQFTKEEMLEAGFSPDIVNHPNFVAAKGIMENAEMFDANFFGISPREAELMDPQHRVLMECAWSAMEDAGVVPEQYPGRIAVFTSAGMNTYLPFNLMSNPELLEQVGGFELSIYNDKDFVPTRIAYSMNIKGPAIDIGTACSSSLVSTHLACQQLLTYQADMTIVGGITIHLPQKMGHIHEPGAAYSPDSHCRPFDATPSGLIDGNGAAVIILKRLEDALKDGDKIHALIKGSAINNDGSDKVGYSAPSVNGQAEVILEAQAAAEVDPSTISYVEAHGTSTPLGDPIEVGGLTQAFRVHTDKTGFCGLGSVKSNIGHVDKAAGLAGLVKTTLALEHELIPPSLNWQKPNPKLQIEKTPFYVVDRPTEWKRTNQPRRAGISSFGVGGTNAHAILEEPPLLISSPSSRSKQLITLSAKTKQSLEDYILNLSSHLSKNPDLNLADVANTLSRGRKAFQHKLAFTCSNVAEAIELLKSQKPTEAKNQTQPVFMFTGQGSQYAGMGEALYKQEKVFADAIDECAQILQPLLGMDIKEILYPLEADKETANLRMQETSITQPCLFATEYALAKLWMQFGVTPTAMIGHSLGEYVAACIAGVFSLEDALLLVMKRSQLMQEMSSGSMLSTPLSSQEIRDDLRRLNLNLEIAAENSPELCVVSGPTELIVSYQSDLESRGISSQILKTSHAFHSAMMEPMLASFEKVLGNVKWHEPSIPFISNLHGTWITKQEAINPQYWSAHLRNSVLFSQGIKSLINEIEHPLFIEIGPGKTLSQLTQLNQSGSEIHMINSLPQAFDKKSASDFWVDSLAKAWLNNQPIDWNAYYENEDRLKVSLPTYPFERTRYWIEPRKSNTATQTQDTQFASRQTNPNHWFYCNTWKSSPLVTSTIQKPSTYLIFASSDGLMTSIKDSLIADGHTVICASFSSEFMEEEYGNYSLDLATQEQLERLYTSLQEKSCVSPNIIYIAPASEKQFTSSIGLVNLLKAFHQSSSVQIIASGTMNLFSSTDLHPENSSILGLLASARYELPSIHCSLLDITLEMRENPMTHQNVIHWLHSKNPVTYAALRNGELWTQSIETIGADYFSDSNILGDNKTYLILGGLDGVGCAFSQAIAESVKGNLILSTADRNFENNAQIQLQIEGLKKLGSTIFPIFIDPNGLQSTINEVSVLAGPIHGIIDSHDMSASQHTGLIQDLDVEAFEKNLQQQQSQLKQLAQFVDPLKLQFCIVMSSLSAKIGGIGQASHACTGNLINAFANLKNLNSQTPWIVMNWDRWDASAGNEGFSPEEGLLAFKKSLGLVAIPNFMIATNNPSSRAQSSLKIAANSINTNQEEENLYSRPELGNEFLAPSSESEVRLAKLWQDCLKINRIGVLDNFFDLGGHSLLAAQLIRQIKQSFEINLDLGLFFSAPTIAELALVIDQQSSSKRTDGISKEINQIENMTDEEVEALLAGDHTPEELLKIMGKLS
jgi:acyl transferase domain-containing protein